MSSELEDIDSVRSYVLERGIAQPAGLRIERLLGGVSSHVYRVSTGTDCFVLKQARRRLDVRTEWTADPGRSDVEAAFASLATRLVGNAVPRPRYVDSQQHVFTMECAPDGTVSWKSQLLAGNIEPATAICAAQLIGAIHSSTRGNASIAACFGSLDLFTQLRINPYFGALSLSDPQVQTRLDELVSVLLGPGKALVHGDFSPKNLLVAPDGRLFLVDHEVAHYGDPAFDIAFCLSHLCLKAFHAPDHVSRLRAAATSFAAAYQTTAGEFTQPFDERVGRLVAGLMLARIDGKSPVEYLADRTRAAVRVFAISCLVREQASISALLGVLEEAVR